MKEHLLNNFYSEISSDFSQQTIGEFTCNIQLDPEHQIYKGHFDGLPVAPGVCLTQIIKELLIDKFQKNLIMVHADNIKFLAIIDPNKTPLLNLSFLVKQSENMFHVSANYSYNNSIYMKFKGKFMIIE